MEHEDNEHWWLTEDKKGHVGYVPVPYVMIIMDETVQEFKTLVTRPGKNDKWDTCQLRM